MVMMPKIIPAFRASAQLFFHHTFSSVRTSPTIPVGRKISTSTRMPKAITSLSWKLIPRMAGPRRFNQSQEQAAQHGTGNAADATQNGGSKGFDAGDESDEIIDQAQVDTPHDTRRARQCSTDDESAADDAIHIDAHQSSHLLVFCHCPHGTAQPGAHDQ